MIAKNEEKHIARCIESYKDIADEIIVVDTGSTDQTVNIAKGLGAKIFHHEWNNDFAKAKNFALDKATGDWIIFLDADEYFYDGTCANVPKVLQSVHTNSNIQGIYCKFYHVDKDNQFKLINSDFLLRIFRNNRKIRYMGEIHEQVLHDNKPLKVISANEKLIKIYHTGYSTNIFKSKLERNLEPLLTKLNENPNDVMTTFYLSDCYYGLGNYELAIHYARLTLENKLNTFSHNVKPYFNLINSMIKLQYPFAEILEVINEAIDKFPNHPDFQRFLGLHYFNDAKYIQACYALEKSLELFSSYNGKEVCTERVHLKNIYLQLGRIYNYRNNHTRAFEYFIQALKEQKNDVIVFEYIIKLLKNEKSEEIIFLLKSIYDENRKDDIEFLVTNLSKHRMGIVLMYFHNIWLKKFGEEDIIIMYMLLSIGKYEEAFKHFSQAMLLENGEWAAPYAVITAILSERREYINLIFDLLNSSLKRIVEVYFDLSKSVSLTTENLNDYLNILNEFILLKAFTQVDKMINLKRYFSVDTSKAIGDLLLNNMVYGKAIVQYLDALEQGQKNEPELYFKLGYASFKSYEYANALAMFEKTVELGYQKDDIFAYFYWISEQCNDENLKRKALLLIEKMEQRVNI